jgi:GxxExxY protein
MTPMDTEKAESSTGKTKLLHKELTAEILGGFFAVYNALGYGFLEHVYSNALSLELRNRGLSVVREVLVEVQ